jgi:hypothetical protein
MVVRPLPLLAAPAIARSFLAMSLGVLVLVPRKPYKLRSKTSKRIGSFVKKIANDGPGSRADVARRNLPILECNLKKLRAEGLSEDSPQVQYHKRTIERFKRDVERRRTPARTTRRGQGSLCEASRRGMWVGSPLRRWPQTAD